MNQYSPHYESGFRVQRENVTWAVQRLIVLNILLFAVQLLLEIAFGEPSRLPLGGLPVYWLLFKPSALFTGAVWQPFTYMFLHSGLMHLFGNMLWLFFFGPEVERVLGTRQFVKFYILCGVLAVLVSVLPLQLLGLGKDIPVIGASGAVMAVLVAFAVVDPERQFFLIPFPFPINARGMVMLVIALNLVAAVGESNVSVATHFGGMVIGFVYMKTVPSFRQWMINRQRPKSKSESDGMDPLGEAIDNIFKFENEKRRKK